MAFRIERIEKTIERELSMIFFLETRDERLKNVTVTKVKLTNDGSLATISFTTRKEVLDEKVAQLALEAAKGFLKTELSKRLDIRKIPDLRFRVDDSLDYGNKIESILTDFKKLKQEGELHPPLLTKLLIKLAVSGRMITKTRIFEVEKCLRQRA
jgi:ribosome-binding factor A